MTSKTTCPCEPIFGSEISKEVAFSRLPFYGPNIVNAVAVSPPQDGFSSTYRNSAIPRVVSTIHPDVDTLNKAFNATVEINGNNKCFGYRPYNYVTKKSENYFKSMTYKEVNKRKRHVGAGLIHHLTNSPFLLNTDAHNKIKRHLQDWPTYGIGKAGRDNVDFEIEKSCSFIISIFSANRYEWYLTDFACGAYSITNTALYDNLGSDVTKYILELTNSTLVICSKDKIQVLLELKLKFPQQLQNLISIVCMDPIEYVDPSFIKKATQLNIELVDLNHIENLGKNHPMDELPQKPDALYTISFTSGTTGSKPKGAMLSQATAMAAITLLAASEEQAGTKGSSVFVFLPLTHIYERQTSGFALIGGYYLGFPQLTVDNPRPDSFKNLVEDLRIFKPTYFSIVPRVLTKFEALIKYTIREMDEETQKKVNHIIEWKSKEQAKYDGSMGKNEEYDNYPPYQSLKSLIGFDNLKWTQTASAPVAPSTLIYLKASLGIGIRQLYGLTELSGAHSISDAYEASSSSCGPCGVSTEIKLRDASSMGYDIKKNMGELLIGGAQVFKGYYLDKIETDKIFTEDGWLISGDIARLDSTGRIYILDRAKNFFKLAQGEYISPEKIEVRYLSNNALLSQCYVHGNPTRSFLIGILGIEPKKGLNFLIEECSYDKKNMTDAEIIEELNKVENKKKILNFLNKNVGKQLSGFEKLHNVYIEVNPLTVERNVVTPTFKLKRNLAAKYFSKQIHHLYEVEKSLLDAGKQVYAKL
jgi:long-chain acyl-CoA synthetase